MSFNEGLMLYTAAVFVLGGLVSAFVWIPFAIRRRDREWEERLMRMHRRRQQEEELARRQQYISKMMNIEVRARSL